MILSRFSKQKLPKERLQKKQAAKEGGLKGTISLQIDKNETLDVGTDNERNFGYVALSRIYHELEIDKFIKNRQRHANHQYDANAIMRLLVFSRLLYPPDSKKKDWENRERFFWNREFFPRWCLFRTNLSGTAHQGAAALVT